MTTLEAQQCGCIPIVYDSFPTAHELITDGETGILVKNNDREAFVKKLKHLMLEEQLRKDMSIQCMESTLRFSVENVATLWNNLLQSL
jgi:glycosyltransferase involved in cell wall biosynthesis